MSRKRNRGEARVTPSDVPEAIPEDIVAEGSGPVQAICRVGIDAIGADVAAEAPASLEAVARRRVRRKKPAAAEAEADAASGVDAASDTDAVAGVDAALGADAEGDAVGDADTDAADQPAAEAESESGREAIAAADADAADHETGDAAAAMPTGAAALPPEQLKQLVEALVFASDKPMTLVRLRQLTRIADVKKLEATLSELAADYADRGLVLQQVSGGYQFRTRTEWSAWVQQLIAGRPVRLTRAQLETLAIIAYRQPITRPEIDDIRGVDSSATLKLLIDRQLIRILGKKEEVGRPMLYGTTKEFLDFFSLGDLRELPTLREYSELTDESRQVIDDRLGPADDGSDGNEGQGSPDGSPAAGGDGSPSDSGLSAAPETAADLIAAYVAELDAATHRGTDITTAALDPAACGGSGVTTSEGKLFDAELDDAAQRTADEVLFDAMSAEDATPASDAMSTAGAMVAAGDDAELALCESELDESVPLAVETVDSGSLTDIDPFATAEGSGPIVDTKTAIDSAFTPDELSATANPSLLAADVAESADVAASSPGADPPQE